MSGDGEDALLTEAVFDRALSESIDAIVSEVDALQHLVDEFAQFARLPPSRPVEASLNGVVEAALALYETAYPHVVLERKLDPELPLLRLDAPQIKRVLINLVDNAIAAKRLGAFRRTGRASWE